MENLFNWHVEQSRNAKGEREGWVVLARFNGVYGLARDVELKGQVRLAPIAFSAQDFEAVFHNVQCSRIRAAAKERLSFGVAAVG